MIDAKEDMSKGMKPDAKMDMKDKKDSKDKKAKALKAKAKCKDCGKLKSKCDC